MKPEDLYKDGLSVDWESLKEFGSAVLVVTFMALIAVIVSFK